MCDKWVSLYMNPLSSGKYVFLTLNFMSKVSPLRAIRTILSVIIWQLLVSVL